ncbi:MAG: hypothetical protein Ct9H90mP9_5510 [Pseudomonadota bacterium]|nr:MAG: hypothetical protein Ct9H90mP9_5510 [Pseudomonadota bacterium]
MPVPVLLEVLPKQEDEAFKRDTKLTLKFSLPLDPKTLTGNQEDQQCTGTVQLSADDFKTCVRLEKPVWGGLIARISSLHPREFTNPAGVFDCVLGRDSWIRGRSAFRN